MKDTLLETDLMSFPMEKELPPETFIRSEKQNRITVAVFKGGVPYALSGTVSAFCMLPDNTSFSFNQNGSISGNKAIVVLPDACYAQNGKIQIAIVVENGNERTTIGVCWGIVYPTRI